MTDSPDKIEAEVEANRANVESTLDALKSRLSVENVVNEATRFVGINDARGTLVAVGREIRAEPVAFGMIGLGLALLATGVARREPQDPRLPYTPTGRTPQHGYDRTARSMQAGSPEKGLGDRIHEYSDQARNAASDYSSKAGEKVAEYSDAANRRLHDAQHAVHEGYDAVRDRASDFQRRAGQQMESQPLLFGALALAAGAVIAAALPRSSVEDRWVGPARDRLLDEATDVAANLADRGTDAAKAGYAAAVETAKDEGLVPQGGDTIASKVEHVVQAAVAGAKSKIDKDQA